jgi:hypothetical protein
MLQKHKHIHTQVWGLTTHYSKYDRVWVLRQRQSSVILLLSFTMFVCNASSNNPRFYLPLEFSGTHYLIGRRPLFYILPVWTGYIVVCRLQLFYMLICPYIGLIIKTEPLQYPPLHLRKRSSFLKTTAKCNEMVITAREKKITENWTLYITLWNHLICTRSWQKISKNVCTSWQRLNFKCELL